MDILSQEEINALLDICVDEDEYEEGSPEFEKALQEMREDGLNSTPYGNNPGEIIVSLKKTRKEFVEKIKEFKKFEEHYKKIQEIARRQPEMFI